MMTEVGPMGRPTVAEIDLSALRHNVCTVSAVAEVPVIAVVKANAYGHGAVAVARSLEQVADAWSQRSHTRSESEERDVAVGPRTPGSRTDAAKGSAEAGAPRASRAGDEGRVLLWGFAVALLEEAVTLREAGIRRPILVLNGCFGAWGPSGARERLESARLLRDLALHPVVYGADQMRALGLDAMQVGRALSSEARASSSTQTSTRASMPWNLHVKFDTGMHRLGAGAATVDALRETMLAMGHAGARLRLAGCMTHFASADEDVVYTGQQLARFAASLDAFGVARARGPWADGKGASEARGAHLTGRDGAEPLSVGARPLVAGLSAGLSAAGLLSSDHRLMVHAANSPATLRHPEARFDAVRTGMALYGHWGCPEGCGEGKSALRAVMRWKTEVIRVHVARAGETVGYGRSFRAPHDTLVATLPVGYGDGYARSAGNRACVLIRGVRCPVIGRVSMDLLTVDATQAQDVTLGDEAVLLGVQGEDDIRLEELAAWMDTNVYEVTTQLSARVSKVLCQAEAT